MRMDLFLQIGSDCAVYILILITFIYNQKLSDVDTIDLLEQTQFIDLTKKTYYYDSIFILEAMLFFLLIFKLLMVFRLNRYIHIMFCTIENVTLDYSFIIIGYWTYSGLSCAFLPCALGLCAHWNEYLGNLYA